MEDAEVLDRAAKAKAELQMTERACAGIRQAALEELIITAPGDRHKIERLIVTAQIIDAVRLALQQAVAAGDVANYRNLLAEHTDVLRPGTVG